MGCYVINIFVRSRLVKGTKKNEKLLQRPDPPARSNVHPSPAAEYQKNLSLVKGEFIAWQWHSMGNY